MIEVSIVLPTYNGEKYIKQSIESVISQTYKNWELIIVDDCSSDNTLNIAREYEKKDSRIRVIHNEKNQKLPNSLNIGFSYSKGEFLTWTSDDNIYMSNAIETMLNYLKSHKNECMVCTDMKIIDENGNIIGDYYGYDEETIGYFSTVGACFMYRRIVLDEIGNYDDSKFCVEDLDYWLKIIKKWGKIGYIKESLYYYRRHKESLTDAKSDMVKRQSTYIWRENFNWIINRMQNQPKHLCRMYYDFYEYGDNPSDLYDTYVKYVPQLRFDNIDIGTNKKLIAFGAGNYGKKAIEKLNDKIVYFADSNNEIVGRQKFGRKILSVKDMISKSKEYDILLSVGDEKIYDLLKVLEKNNIKCCCVFQRIARKL